MLDPESPVRVAGICRIEEADMVQAYREVPALRQRQALWVTAAFGALAAFLPVYGLSMGRDSAAYFGTAVVFAILTGFSLNAYLARGKRQWRALPEWNRQVRFELTDTGFRVRTERTAQELDWGLHPSFTEGPDAFYVQAGANYQIVPKRAFATGEEIDRVREMLRDKIRPGVSPPPVPNRTARTFLLWLVLIALMLGIYWVTRR